MSDLQVENKDGILVVDSRLVADKLEISHKSFHETIRTYLPKYEIEFGAVPAETATRSDGNTGGNQPIFYWLTEQQATFLMTLSRNTEPVVKAKASLVLAFEKARGAVGKQTELALTNILLDRLAAITGQLDQQQAYLLDLNERTQRLDEVESKLTLVKEASQRHRGCGNVIQSEVENEGVEDNLFTAKEYLILKKVSVDHFRTLSKRAANFTRVGKGEAPTAKRSGHLLFEETYLREALKSILELD